MNQSMQLPDTSENRSRGDEGVATMQNTSRNLRYRDKLTRLFRTPQLTRTRIVLALTVAVVADGSQLLLGPFGWAFVDEIIDIVAMLLTTVLIGFHWLLLPTFVVEFFPVTDMLPTWTGCAIAVIALRKRVQGAARKKPSINA